MTVSTMAERCSLVRGFYQVKCFFSKDLFRLVLQTCPFLATEKLRIINSRIPTYLALTIFRYFFL
jgi:hypothetical protein